MLMDEVLKKLNLKFEDLTTAERDTLLSWVEQIDNNQLTIEKIKSYIHSMKEAVEQELTKFDNNEKQDLMLKARLKNLMLLEAFLSSPDKAREQLTQAVTNLAKPRATKGGEI